MKIRGLLADRQPLIAALERETGVAAIYSGMPSFRYQVGAYTVLRDGGIEVADGKADTAMLDRLAGLGLIERTGSALGGISFDASEFTGQTMTNIVNSFSARGLLINKAIGIPNAFHMSVDLVRELKIIKPTAMTEFMAILHSCGGQSTIKGLSLGVGRISFPGFPDNTACRTLAERIVHAAVTSRWIKGKAPAVSNEKYSFRVWLNSLGMKGEAYAEARAELLKNLSGDSAFRTEEQRAAFYAARRKKPAPEPDFVLL